MVNIVILFVSFFIGLEQNSRIIRMAMELRVVFESFLPRICPVISPLAPSHTNFSEYSSSFELCSASADMVVFVGPGVILTLYTVSQKRATLL